MTSAKNRNGLVNVGHGAFLTWLVRCKQVFCGHFDGRGPRQVSALFLCRQFISLKSWMFDKLNIIEASLTKLVSIAVHWFPECRQELVAF